MGRTDGGGMDGKFWVTGSSEWGTKSLYLFLNLQFVSSVGWEKYIKSHYVSGSHSAERRDTASASGS